MTLREIHRIEKLLEHRKADLEREVEASLDRLVEAHNADPLEKMIDLIEQDEESPRLRILTSDLHRVEHALQAIDSDRFGRCEACGAPIPARSLREAPWSSCCAGCQESAEMPQARTA
jgi:RNA polymerase-binding transcription factor DksA